MAAKSTSKGGFLKDLKPTEEVDETPEEIVETIEQKETATPSKESAPTGVGGRYRMENGVRVLVDPGTQGG